jgi:predicted dehydrogenase
MTNTENQNPSQKTEPVKVGLVGYGWWGKTMARNMANSSWLKLVAVVETDPAVRAQMAGDATSMGFKVEQDFQAFLDNPAMEAVILCSPHTFHADQIVAASQAGKHVFCEKPLCMTLADAKRAIASCEQHGRLIGIGHERRFEPAVRQLRADIAAGKLGTVLQIEGNFSQDKFFALPKDNWRLSNKHAPVGPLTATGIHLVDLAIAILGPAEAVWARLATRGSDFENGDTLGLMLAFPGGANALISAILATPFEGRFTVYGSKGWVEIRDRTHPEKPTGWDITTVLRDQAPQTHFVPPHASVLANLEAFAQAIRGVAPYPVSKREMLANVAALEAIMTSVKSQQIQTIAAPTV